MVRVREEKRRAEKSREEKREKRREEKRREEKRREEERRKKIKKRKSLRKVAEHTVFSLFCGSAWSKSRLAKAAGAEPCGQMRDEKLYAVVARSRFRSQNAQSTSASEHF